MYSNFVKSLPVDIICDWQYNTVSKWPERVTLWPHFNVLIFLSNQAGYNHPCDVLQADKENNQKDSGAQL